MNATLDTTETAVTPDFEVSDDFSFAYLLPQTPDASDWINENICEERTEFAGQIVVEKSYIEDICEGIIDAGLTIFKDGLEMFLSKPGGALCLRKPQAV